MDPRLYDSISSTYTDTRREDKRVAVACTEACPCDLANSAAVDLAMSRTDWHEAVSSIAVDGWVRLQGALSEAAVGTLQGAQRPPWHALPEEEGVVRQLGLASYLPLVDCEERVRQVASEIVTGLSAAAEVAGFRPVPPFNEASWTHYPAGAGYITAHRDPSGCGGVIAIVTLCGAAMFRVGPGEAPTEWVTASGDLVILRGRGWPTTAATCPIHSVGSPLDGDRMIMTLRHNTGGAGADYFV